MSKKRVWGIVLGLLCIAVIGICCIAGVNKWRAHQAELQQQQQSQEQHHQQLTQYTEDLTDAFDDLYQVENNLFQDIAAQRIAGADDRTTLQSMLSAAAEPIDTLASVQAPDELSDVQEHFQKAASSYHAMSDTLTDMLRDPAASDADVQKAFITALPNAIDALDEVKAGISLLAENSDITLPDSAKQLETALDSFSGDSFSSLFNAKS